MAGYEFLCVVSAGNFHSGAGYILLRSAGLLGGWFRTQQWPVWKEILLIVGSGILGMLARWLLEYGEVWWQENFTAENTVRHVVALAVCGVVLSFLLRHLTGKKIS